MRYIRYNVDYETEEGSFSTSYLSALYAEFVDEANAANAQNQGFLDYQQAHHDGLITERTVTTEETDG